MKDQLLLLAAGAICAAAAWAFWSFLGLAAFDVLISAALVAITADNIHLRRKLRRLERRDGQSRR